MKKHAILHRVASHPYFPLAFITLFGAILRFGFLSQPPLWGDEAKTFGRVCGTFQQLIDSLAGTDFSPLHYLLYWSIAQFAKLTPVVMRLPPAIAGTLMVPAIYWLAVQIFPRRTAMVVALFTACSAFMLNFSRDAKMYAECWLFVTLSTASLLQFLKTRSRFAWYGWVIFSLAMVGLQIVTVLVLVIQILILLSHPKLHWKSAIAIGLGVCLIIWPLAVYTKYFNRYADRIEGSGRLSAGTQWLEGYNRGRNGADLRRYTGTAFLYSWEWPRAADEKQIDRSVLRALKVAGYGMGILLVLGVLPWRIFRQRSKDRSETPGDRAHANGTNWRPLFLLTVWLVLPAYGFYCASIKARLAPWEILRTGISHPLWVGLTLVVIGGWFYLAGQAGKSRLRNAIPFIASACALFGLCCLIYLFTPNQGVSVWLPRYLGIVWPAFAIATCALLLRLPTAALRWSAIILLLAINLTQHGARVFAASEPPTDLMTDDVMRAYNSIGEMRIYNILPASPLGEPGTGTLGTYPARYYLAIKSGKPITPSEMRSITWENEFGVFNLLFRLTANFTIAQNVAGSAQLKRIIIWDRVSAEGPNGKPLSEMLPPGWKLVAQSDYPTRDHWTWRNLLIARRSVYERS